MQWWDRAAALLTAPGSPLRRFGFVTTNSITQEFSRRVIQRHLSPSPSGEGSKPRSGEGGGEVTGTSEREERRFAPRARPTASAPTPNPSPKGEGLSRPLSLVMACPDHPWTKAARDAAAVRIAMTVAEAGTRDGDLVEVEREAGLDTDTPTITVSHARARIHADLSIGSDLATARPLLANEGLSSPGVKLHGDGFIVQPDRAHLLGLDRRDGLSAHLRPYRNGRDLLQRSRGALVIDLFGLDEREARTRFPEVWTHLHDTVREDRRKQVERSPTTDAKAYLESWWIFGKPRRDLRDALAGLPRYIVTVETAKHRVFQFLAAEVLPDNMLVAIATDDPFHLGVLSSRLHTEWALRTGGTLEDRPRYTKAKVFDPFPFPDATPAQRAAVAELAEELDATRRAALAEHPRLTMTGLYNLVDKLRAGARLAAAEEEIARDARARIVGHLHAQLDRAVADAYAWPHDLPPADIVARLVHLNAERAAEEANGTIRWLRPDHQLPRLAAKAKRRGQSGTPGQARGDGEGR